MNPSDTLPDITSEALAQRGLPHNVERLAIDHAAASDMAVFLQSLPYISTVISPETNILIFTLNKDLNQGRFIADFDQFEALHGLPKPECWCSRYFT